MAARLTRRGLFRLAAAAIAAPAVAPAVRLYDPVNHRFTPPFPPPCRLPRVYKYTEMWNVQKIGDTIIVRRPARFEPHEPNAPYEVRPIVPTEFDVHTITE